MNLTWRTLTPEDREAWVDIWAAAEAVDQTHEHLGDEDFTELLSDYDDLTEESVAAFDGDELVAQGTVWLPRGTTDTPRARLIGVVRPSHRDLGVGRELLDRMSERARHLWAKHGLTQPIEELVTIHSTNTGAQDLVKGLGFSPARWFHDMTVSLSAEPPASALPDGLRLEPYDPAAADELRLVNNISFRTHWGSSIKDEEAWNRMYVGGPSFCPEQSVFVRDEATGAAVAFILSRFYAADSDATGGKELYVSDVATLPQWRGKGVASAMLSAVLRAARAAGYDSAQLSVDSDNATGALGVYRRCGFEVTDVWTAYVRAVPQP